LKNYVSRGNAATELKCGGISNNYVIAMFTVYASKRILKID